ncbi:PhzF family phenazine biosynthesis protein [Dongshaea marina]|uniref:PhzF family phenazine biosynthesis protein n=1 Tax=Dongshaea marina TaxID=2047966 RepID=UPI000D3E94FD|nr:PhzF family phenazine biosynthesis isomerase [Dongshaea marina]
MELEIYQVDAFTSQLFKGNPAGVCITQQPLGEPLMLAIAAELAVSETAFFSLNDSRLRWFTPRAEVNLCGHGTLALTHVLKEKGLASLNEEISFNTLSGALRVKVTPENIELNFPEAELELDLPMEEELLSLLGLHSKQVLAYGRFDKKILIEVQNEQILEGLKPNFEGLRELEGRGVLITAKATSTVHDFTSRYFAPWVGVNEDPVTGSAHCALAVYWGNKLTCSSLLGYQASERGGYVRLERLENQRVKLIGQAVTAFKGTLFLPD